MSPAQQIAAARELISEAGNEIVESILLRDGHYIGRKFRFDGGHAIWECGEPQLSIYKQDGTLVKRLALMLERQETRTSACSVSSSRERNVRVAALRAA
jgi:hypothetical protein